ncbi:hypothetical protein [Larkinella sp.]|uniref:hypothetical protein n=1 Tax=Larkinella sp. TaxID=2034517 RepID=UPI003BAD43B4
MIGTAFEWIDLLAYTLGVLFVVYLEKTKTARRWNRSGVTETDSSSKDKPHATTSNIPKF